MPMPKVENFCGGVQVTIERTKFVQMTNVGGVTKECHQFVTSQTLKMSPIMSLKMSPMSVVLSVVCHQLNYLKDKRICLIW